MPQERQLFVVASAQVLFYEAEFQAPLVERIRTVHAFFEKRAIELLGFEVEVISSVEQGSVDSRLTFVAKLAAIMMAIEHYGGVCDGVERIYRQSRQMIEYVTRAVISIGEQPHASTFIDDASTGLPGVLKRFNDEVQFLSEHWSDLSPRERSMRLKQLREFTDRLLERVADHTEQNIVRSQLYDAGQEIMRRNSIRHPDETPRPSRMPELDLFLEDLLDPRRKKK